MTIVWMTANPVGGLITWDNPVLREMNATIHADF